MYYLDGRWRRQSLVYFTATLSVNARAMFPGPYSEIFGLGEQPGCILNLGHSFDAVSGVCLNLLVCRYTLAHAGKFRLASSSAWITLFRDVGQGSHVSCRTNKSFRVRREGRFRVLPVG